MIVAPMWAGAVATKSAASRVVMCSSTILSAGKSRNDAREHLVDEHAFAIEHVDLGRGDFAVNQQRQRMLLHRFERRVHAFDGGNA